MLRNLSTEMARKVPELTEKIGVIVGTGATPFSYQVQIDGNTYFQVWSANNIFYSVGMQVKIVMDRATPTIVP